MHTSRRPAVLSCTLLLVMGLPQGLQAESAATLDQKVIAANRELDQRLLDAHERRDIEMLAGLFANGADTFFISPDGTVYKGKDAVVRDGFGPFFATLERIHGEIKEIVYSAAGDGVIALGTVVYRGKFQNRPPYERTVVWTDFRRKEGDKWVYVFRHAHWPMDSNNIVFAPKQARGR